MYVTILRSRCPSKAECCMSNNQKVSMCCRNSVHIKISASGDIIIEIDKQACVTSNAAFRIALVIGQHARRHVS